MADNGTDNGTDNRTDNGSVVITTTTKNEFIFDHDLRMGQYSISVLEENIVRLTNKTLLYTQKLTADFCVKYILNEEYSSCVEETYINAYDVLQAQLHITKEELSDALKRVGR